MCRELTNDQKVEEFELDLYSELLEEPSVKVYGQILDLLMEEIFAERGCLWLETDNAFLYRGDEELRKRFPFSRQAVDEVLEHGRSFISFDTTQDTRLRPSGSIALNNVRSCLCAACRDSSGEVLVLAYFDNGMSAGEFSQRDLDYLKAVLSLVPGATPVAG